MGVGAVAGDRVPLGVHVGVDGGDEVVDRRRARLLQRGGDGRLPLDAGLDVPVDAGLRALDELSLL